jgi:hypothetical protein
MKIYAKLVFRNSIIDCIHIVLVPKRPTSILKLSGVKIFHYQMFCNLCIFVLNDEFE